MTNAGRTWGRPQACASRGYLARAHQRHEQCFILLEGILIRQKLLDGGQRQIVGLNVPGDVCGLTALSDGYADHDMVALSPVSCLPVSRQWLMSTACESADLSQAVWRELARETAIAATWIVNLGQKPAYQRLAHFMCEVEARLRAARPGKDARYEWPGTQADISAATGLSLVHVNRTLRRLEDDRILSCGRRIKFLDVPRLRAVADFDPAYLALERETLGELLLSRIDEIDPAAQGEKVFVSPVEAPSLSTTAPASMAG